MSGMLYESTRGAGPAVGIGAAIRSGAAPDGGLYVPRYPVSFEPDQIDGRLTLAQIGAQLLAPYFEGDPLGGDLATICAESFFPAPLTAPDRVRQNLRVLELFHGPTGAFKDFGARFLMACLERLGRGSEPMTVLAATSGDTGGAVGCAAERRKGLRAVILFPKGRVSEFQALQLSCWGNPVLSLEVEGDFDDCQRLVKTALADPELSGLHRFTSANSINIGRLLPQMVYFAAAALQLKAETGKDPGFLIPTGNLGHAVSALLARAAGLPVGPIIAVTNSNATLAEWHRTGEYRPRPSRRTMATAMDVGAPSNFERLIRMPEPIRALAVERVEDEAICERIRCDHASCGYVWDPHSATAAEAYARLDPAARESRLWVVAATAHPYKFAELVEPLIGREIAPPPALAAIRNRPSRASTIPATLDALAGALGQ